jgi:hypothetical protein
MALLVTQYDRNLSCTSPPHSLSMWSALLITALNRSVMLNGVTDGQATVQFPFLIVKLPSLLYRPT